MKPAAILLLTALATLGPMPGPAPDGVTQSTSRSDRSLQRGRYLTERVAMCIQCHSPRDEDGALIRERKFQGAPIPVDGPAWGPEWAVEAPAIAGITFYSREEFVRLLTEGIGRDGEPPKPPMPPFRMSEADATAIYDYLASLPEMP